MTRILVALKDSRGSEKALEAAVKIAQLDGGKIDAITVLDRTGNPKLDHLSDRIKLQLQKKLHDLLQAANNFAKSRGVLLTPILREGHPADTIITYAEEMQANLVVLGAQNEDDPQAGLDDTADQVSSHCPCNVLIVK
jgi:nucleotide-binding universal stress UspA family protein